MIKSNNSAKYLSSSANKNISHNKVFSNLTIKDFDSHSELKGVISHKRHPTIDFLTKDYPSISSTQGITDENTYNLVNSLNSFRKHYHKYTKEEEKGIRTHNKVLNENKQFSRQYKLIFKSNKDKMKTLEENKHLNNIKAEYEKMNYKIPQLSLDHNIFKQNPLLLSNLELYRYYLYQRGNPSTEVNTLKYLNKVNDELFAFSKENSENNSRLKANPLKDKYEQKKAFKLLLHDIKKNQIEIKRTQDTLNKMDNDDLFVTNTCFNCKTEREKQQKNNELEEVIKREANLNINEIQTRDHSGKRSNNKSSTRISSGGKSVLSRCNSIKKIQKPLNIVEIKEGDDNSKTERFYSQNKKTLECLYDEVKSGGVNNRHVTDINNYFLDKKSFNSNDHSARGVFNQIQFIKARMMNKDYLNDNCRLKGYKISEDASNNCLAKVKENQKLEHCLLDEEKLLVRIAYRNMK